MYDGQTILALIPARGGSKGVPRKNLRCLSGKPLIAYTIEAALQANFIDKIIVSTDDLEIANVSKKYGAEVPFIRPEALATDEAKGIDVILHAMQWLEDHNEKFDLLILLQPTSPLRDSEDIKNALSLFVRKNADAVVSVCEAEHSPLWMNTLREDLCMKDFIRKEVLNKNRQELETYYRLNGAIYLAKWNYIKQYKSFYGDKTYAYIMSREKSVDIDSEFDLQFAEFLMKNKNI
ncbi:CMP-N,N'-diacetyllegionaminic acid synthase [Caldanaerobius fijiensis DSM 17918]|uniref:CMP-N,N'-diacetyllegionaminic acid synthase n=1 Tax=Caldanaerobius fijiensis DSM 17918 TaxID=1121256 RepID=A0A1M4V3C6_9THEO|nr:acylneuraminate cytidylyltransferase family protein [Caldanaerobius fijiensis]SHE63383.1 CMP-N,N'-diacetyllegionaminic acid synthase [Caldanaerobius fijiensis DSM 17918]